MVTVPEPVGSAGRSFLTKLSKYVNSFGQLFKINQVVHCDVDLEVNKENISQND